MNSDKFELDSPRAHPREDQTSYLVGFHTNRTHVISTWIIHWIYFIIIYYLSLNSFNILNIIKLSNIHVLNEIYQVKNPTI